MSFRISFCMILLFGLFQNDLSAETVLPYTTRTLPYSLGTTTLQGDIPSIGMAGALVGLGDTFMGTLDNPACTAMTLSSTGLQLDNQRVFDGTVQDANQAVSKTNFISAINPYPWGFGLAIWVPHKEEQPYEISGSGTKINPQVKVTEARFTAARVFFRNRLSLGLSLGSAFLDRSLTFPNSEFPVSSSQSASFVGSFGMMIQLPKRWFIGSSYSWNSRFSDQTANVPSPGISNFHQGGEMGQRFAIGAGWIPNRFFKLGFGAYFIHHERGTALLSSENSLVRSGWTVQPRLGARYQFIEYRELKGALSMGTYIETPKVTGQAIRPHFTGAMELSPWILTLGAGVDLARTYENIYVSVGIDLLKLMVKLDLAPPGPRWKRGEFLPRIDRFSDHGLPRPLVKRWTKKREGPNAIDVTRKLPGRVKKKMKKTGDSIDDFFDEFGSIPSNFRKSIEKRKREQKKLRKSKK